MTEFHRRVQARGVRKGHRIVCPADDEIELVESVKGNRNGVRLIITERHEHFRDIDETMTRVVRR